MNTAEQGTLMRNLEGAVAAAIVAEWRANTKWYGFSFPGVSVCEHYVAPAHLKSITQADMVEDGYGVIVECPVQRTSTQFQLKEEEAQAAAKIFQNCGEPDAKLRKTVRKMLDKMNQA